MINEDLVAAAQYMDEHGKCTGRYVDEQGQVCMMGAIHRVIWRGDIRAFGSDVGMERRARAIAARRLVEDYWLSKSHIRLAITELSDSHIDGKEETVKFMMEAAEYEPNK